MGNLAGVDMGAIIHSCLGGEPLVLRKLTDGGQATDINAGFTRVSCEYSCDGYPGAVDMSRVKDTLVREGMVVFGIYGDGLSVRPEVNDEIDYAGQEAEAGTYVIYHVMGGSTGSVWVAYATLIES